MDVILSFLESMLNKEIASNHEDFPEFAEPAPPESLQLQLNLPLQSEGEFLEPAAPEILSQTQPIFGISLLLKISTAATNYFSEAVKIDRDTITDQEMQPARIYAGLTCIGFSALGLIIFMFYLTRFHPELAANQWHKHYWYPYIFLVSLGVAGMFMLGRESLRRTIIKEQE